MSWPPLNAVIADGASRNVRAVNLSVAATGDRQTAECSSSMFSSPFASLRGAGIVPVVAAGNDAFGGGFYQDGVAEPACATGALRVGAEWDTAFLGTGTFNPSTTYACIADEPHPHDHRVLLAVRPRRPAVRLRPRRRDHGGGPDAVGHVPGRPARLGGHRRPRHTRADGDRRGPVDRGHHLRHAAQRHAAVPGQADAAAGPHGGGEPARVAPRCRPRAAPPRTHRSPSPSPR